MGRARQTRQELDLAEQLSEASAALEGAVAKHLSESGAPECPADDLFGPLRSMLRLCQQMSITFRQPMLALPALQEGRTVRLSFSVNCQGQKHSEAGCAGGTRRVTRSVRRALVSPALTVAVRGQSARSATSPKRSPGFSGRSTVDWPSLPAAVTTGWPDTTTYRFRPSSPCDGALWLLVSTYVDCRLFLASGACSRANAHLLHNVLPGREFELVHGVEEDGRVLRVDPLEESNSLDGLGHDRRIDFRLRRAIEDQCPGRIRLVHDGPRHKGKGVYFFLVPCGSRSHLGRRRAAVGREETLAAF